MYVGININVHTIVKPTVHSVFLAPAKREAIYLMGARECLACTVVTRQSLPRYADMGGRGDLSLSQRAFVCLVAEGSLANNVSVRTCELVQ